jgi:hypothetical protein
MLAHASGAGRIDGLLRAGLRVSMKGKPESCYDFFVLAVDYPPVGQSLLRCKSGGFVAIEHRGFRVNVNVVPDELGVQWMCKAVIERVDGDDSRGVPEGPELAIPRVKIDPLMAMSSLEQRAVVVIDEFCAQEVV